MAHDNIYGDLLKIANGDVAVFDECVDQFREFANTVSGSPDERPPHESGWTSADYVAGSQDHKIG